MPKVNTRLFLTILFFCAFAYFLRESGWWENRFGPEKPSLDKIAEENPLSPFGRGRNLVAQGDYAEAIQHLELYLKNQPGGKNASRASFFIAKALLGQGDLNAARIAFQRTIAVYPDSLEAHKSRYKLAMIDFWQGNRDEAIRRFTELAEAREGPDTPEAQMMLKYLQEGKY